jgi:hypothetical protein
MKTYQDAAKNIFIAIIKDNDDGEIEVGFDDEKAYLYLQAWSTVTGHFEKVQIHLTKQDITDMIVALQRIEGMM